MHGFTSVCGASGIGKSRFCWELAQSLQREFINGTKGATDEKGEEYLWKDFYSFRYICSDFASASGITKAEKDMKLSTEVCIFKYS